MERESVEEFWKNLGFIFTLWHWTSNKKPGLPKFCTQFEQNDRPGETKYRPERLSWLGTTVLGNVWTRNQNEKNHQKWSKSQDGSNAEIRQNGMIRIWSKMFQHGPSAYVWSEYWKTKQLQMYGTFAKMSERRKTVNAVQVKAKHGHQSERESWEVLLLHLETGKEIEKSFALLEILYGKFFRPLLDAGSRITKLKQKDTYRLL